MKKTLAKRLSLTTATVRQLQNDQLESVAGGTLAGGVSVQVQDPVGTSLLGANLRAPNPNPNPKPPPTPGGSKGQDPIAC